MLDPYGVDTWPPHVLWLSWGSSPLSGEDVRLESAGGGQAAAGDGGAVAVSHRAALQQQRGPAAALPLLGTRPASRRSPVRPRLQIQDQAPHFRVPTNSRVLQPPDSPGDLRAASQRAGWSCQHKKIIQT